VQFLCDPVERALYNIYTFTRASLSSRREHKDMMSYYSYL